jgi:MFS family permease
VLAVAVLGSFMAFVDATIVNIAVPDIARHFPGSRLSSVSWVLNAYNIVFAAFLVGGGQLADLLGRRRVFSFALLAFTLPSQGALPFQERKAPLVPDARVASTSLTVTPASVVNVRVTCPAQESSCTGTIVLRTLNAVIASATGHQSK